jgi:transposase
MTRIATVAYTQEFKLEALRRVRGGDAVRQVRREDNVPEASIRNWVKAQAAGKLGSAEKGRPRGSICRSRGSVLRTHG